MTDPTLNGRTLGTEPSPFEPESTGGSVAIVRRTMLVVGIGAALFGAWWFTRGVADPAATTVAASTGDAGQAPVMLTVESAKRIGVTYATVERGSLASDVRTVGLVTNDETRVKTIAPKVDGYVEQLFVAFTGQPVQEGDSLLRIYSPMLVTAQEELLLAKRLATSVGGANAEAAGNAESLLAGARRRLSYWDVPDEDVARVERTGVVQKTLTLRSPLGGVVVRKDVQSGQRIMAGDPVYQVADLHEVWLEGEVFERDIAVVRAGQPVSAEFVAMPGQPRQGRIIFVASSVSPETRTTQVRVALPNHDLSLKPGMYATIHIRGDTRDGILTVPRSAVLVTGQRSYVFVKGADGMLTPRDVLLGAATDERVEIIRGVAAGDVVVSSATFLVDAESNLGAALGAMKSMPGMDHSHGTKR
jgi:Cu(I)/Ag(I) efflux system membrane fusion protein